MRQLAGEDGVTNALAKFSEAEAKVATCEDVPTLFKYYSVAKAWEDYAKTNRLDRDQVSKGVYVRLLAARRIGELVPPIAPETSGAMGGRGHKGVRTSDAFPDRQRLHEFRQLHAIPDDEFGNKLDRDLKSRGLVYQAFLALGRRYWLLDQRERRAGASPLAEQWDGEFLAGRVSRADVTDPKFIASLPESSVDMVMTDPPWGGEDATQCYEALGRIAARVLRPGGFCATFTGKMYLPDDLHILAQNLDYVWMFGVFQPDSNHKINRWHLVSAWRPIVLLRKPGPMESMPWLPDSMRTTRAKTEHDWQQGIEPALALIGAYTVKAELVLDPFAGSGTFLKAAKDLGRQWIGFDDDEQSVRLANRRLSE